ncbi:hypothetical protein WJX81_000857 [Elliptochloris bilobata]|uniref:Checkpoint protein n=1 Tax=Elliptochloris bilobata TaxID=381761 RepID=A0AAW1SHB2_9CHLO
MKFRAIISHDGLSILTQALLPALEKHGKTCQVLFGPEEVCLLQTTGDADGMHISITLGLEILFEPEEFRCESRHNNLIGFQCEVALFRRVLQAASMHATERLEVKLAMRKVPGSDESKPFLTFTCRGPNLHMVQDLPISRPHAPGEVDALLLSHTQGGAAGGGALCPLYLDLLPMAPRLLMTAAGLKAISGTLRLALARQGHLHLQVAGSGVQLATEVQGLLALPAAAADGAPALTHVTAEGRLREALASGDARTAVVQLKHFSRSLQSVLLTNPAQVLCGIAEGGGHVHLVMVYRSQHEDGGFDDKLSVSYRLPVREDG